MTEFKPFPKIARLSREVVVTEKIDGTNAQVTIERISKSLLPDPEVVGEVLATRDYEGAIERMYAGSRSRWLTRQTDNFGFAKWVQENAGQLWGLGEGSHFGEWWGSGIQRGYGLPKGEKRFSLFNTGRWYDAAHAEFPTDKREFDNMLDAPACCYVVPMLLRGIFNSESIQSRLEWLAKIGSLAAPGFMKPEGIVIYHTAANQYFKKTIEKDEKPKGQV